MQGSGGHTTRKGHSLTDEMAITYATTFSGIGGWELGLNACGWSLQWQCEREPFCRVLLNERFGVPIYDDIRTICESNPPPVDVLIGSPPCQPFSVAGKKNGTADDRHLYPSFIRLVGQIKPRWVLMEQVPAILSIERGRAFGGYIAGLAAFGYSVVWHCVPACAVGANHQRDRIWIIAHAEGGGIRRGSAQGEAGQSPCLCEAIPNADGRRCQQRDEKKWTVSEPDARGSASDASSARLEGQRKVASGTGPQFCDIGNPCWWATEPDVGRSIDGFSAWLDGYYLIMESHESILAYAKSQGGGTIETLQALRDYTSSENVQRETGGHVCISAEDVLFSYLCQLEKRAADEAWLQLARAKVSERAVRKLRLAEKPSCAPLGSRHNRQYKREHPNSLQALSRLLAYDAEKAWSAYSRQNAAHLLNPFSPQWEDGLRRVANGIPFRVDRLKGLGNAVVPQIPYIIGQAINQIESQP
jgi:DNA (cytosine-5)-methyltransferase 1